MSMILDLQSDLKSDLFFRNLRYSAYRTTYSWLSKSNKKKRGRFPLPSCVVSVIRKKYPSSTYTGFVARELPAFKKQRIFTKQLDVFSEVNLVAYSVSCPPVNFQCLLQIQSSACTYFRVTKLLKFSTGSLFIRPMIQKLRGTYCQCMYSKWCQHYII